MTGRSHKQKDAGDVRRIKKGAKIMLVCIPILLVIASFFGIAAASGNQSEKDVTYWNNHRSEIMTDYVSGDLGTDIAGVIRFDENNELPFYSSLDKVNDGAALFGSTMPGQVGRSIILGHEEQGFTYLSKIKIGDEIVVDGLEGEFLYIVKSLEVVVPSEIPFGETDESTLTLVSKYPFRTVGDADRRYVVEAVLS